VHITLFGLPAPRPIRFGHVIAIPGSSTLMGVQLAFQTLAFDANNLAGTLELSNGLHWAIGR